MQSDEIFSRLTPIFCKIFEKPTLELSAETCAQDIQNWDSLNHVTLLMEVERAFGIKFALGELRDLKNVGALVTVIANKLAEKCHEN